MTGRKRAFAAAGLILAGLFASGLLADPGQRPAQPEVRPDAASGAPAGAPVPAPPPRERMTAAVLLAWGWLSIAVLVALLRLRVREADRVFRMGLERAVEETPPKPER